MSKKETIASILDKALVGRALFTFSKWLYGPHIRVVNYHNTPASEMANFEQHLKFYKEHYESVSYTDLKQFFAVGKWTKRRPGLIISFDDGFRDNIDNAVPLLEKYGFKGWFFIPSGMVDATLPEQKEYLDKTKSRDKVHYADGRYVMTWQEIKWLYQHHVIGCHTFSHCRMAQGHSEALLNQEIRVAKDLMEDKVGQRVDIHCWVGGEEHTYTRAAAKKIRESGYKFGFMTNTYPLKSGQDPLQINRTNIETSDPMPVVRFQLSLLMDVLYKGKRARVNEVTKK